MTTKKTAKKTFNWFFFLILFVFTLILGSLIIIWSVNRPFCANSLSCKESLSLKIENGVFGTFNGQKVTPPNIDLAGNNNSNILGEIESIDEKHIYVDLTSQTLKAYQGNVLFMTAKVATGKWHPTPTGDFTIWEKLKATRMSGGEGADAYDLPNVPYVMFFEGSGVSAGQGFSLHGAYWHNNFGHPMSHGCINMRIIDAQKLYDWVNPLTNGNVTAATHDDPGTKITIYGKPL